MIDLLSAAMKARQDTQMEEFNPRAKGWSRDSWAIRTRSADRGYTATARCGAHGCKDPGTHDLVLDVGMHLCKMHLARYRNGLPLTGDLS